MNKDTSISSSRAQQIAQTAHTAGQIRKQAQRWCAGMTRDHRANVDFFMFTDGSYISVTGNRVFIGNRQPRLGSGIPTSLRCTTVHTRRYEAFQVDEASITDCSY